MGRNKQNKSESKAMSQSNKQIPDMREMETISGNDDSSIDISNIVKDLLLNGDFLEPFLDRLVDKVVTKLKDSIDFNTKIIEDLRSELCKRDQAITDLQQQLHRINADFQEEVDQINHYSRRNNIEIHGIPELPQENIYSLLHNIGKTLDCEVQQHDIDIAHRIPSTNKSLPRPIIVKFLNRWKKNEIMVAKKNKKMLTSSLGFSTLDQPIFINDHLTPKTKGILRRAKELRNKGFKFVWSRDGKVFVRKDETSQVKTVKSIDDIVKLETT